MVLLESGAGEESQFRWTWRKRARRRAEERNTITSISSHASDSLQLHEKGEPSPKIKQTKCTDSQKIIGAFCIWRRLLDGNALFGWKIRFCGCHVV